MKTVGQILLIARNSKNLSISDISIELKISKSIIIDLENDNIKNNPDIIFNIGHLRSYSNFLQFGWISDRCCMAVVSSCREMLG